MLSNDPYKNGTRTTPELWHTTRRYGHHHSGVGNPLIRPNRVKEINTVVKDGEIVNESLWERWQKDNPGIELSSPEVIAKAGAARAAEMANRKAAVQKQRSKFVDETPEPIEYVELDVVLQRDAGQSEETGFEFAPDTDVDLYTTLRRAA